MSNTSNQANRLIAEKSPYLLQHAYNPVDWFPWSDEAFDKAKAENKPIFLSIGYSTCHWCHVMAHESFTDETIANFINTNFIAIKVDREERPDIDNTYMKACQLMTGQGGWPLNIFMTPDKIPFYAGTYFPKESNYGLPGLIDVLTQLHETYTHDNQKINAMTARIQQALNHKKDVAKSTELAPNVTEKAFGQLQQAFDPEFGGFGDAPKFPTPHHLLFLMHHHASTGQIESREMVETTLQNMALGGIYDHIGYGFSRYATDKAWHTPHFEKMLYDNALLIIAYVECYQITQKETYRTIAEEIIHFVLTEMQSSDGAFYSAIDADSEGIEGKYYIWRYDEIFAILGETLGDLYTTIYNITPYGSFHGYNIPNLIHSDKRKWTTEFNLTLTALDDQLEKARAILLQARQQRPAPHIDDKQLTGWNALMLTALAKAGQVFHRDAYIEAAEQTSQFIEQNLFQDGRLMARYRDGDTKYPAYLDDYAYLLLGYLSLYNSTFDVAYLTKAIDLAEQMIALFWDNEQGGFFFTGNDSETIISRDKEIFDGALPSGNAAAANGLSKLSYLTGDMTYMAKVQTMYTSFYEEVMFDARGTTHFVQSMFYRDYPTKEVVIIGAKDDPKRQELIRTIEEHFLPHITLLVAENGEQLKSVAPFVKDYKQINQQTTVYICENFTCQLPTTDIQHVLKMLIPTLN